MSYQNFKNVHPAQIGFCSGQNSNFKSGNKNPCLPVAMAYFLLSFDWSTQNSKAAGKFKFVAKLAHYSSYILRIGRKKEKNIIEWAILFQIFSSFLSWTCLDQKPYQSSKCQRRALTFYGSNSKLQLCRGTIGSRCELLSKYALLLCKGTILGTSDPLRTEK